MTIREQIMVLEIGDRAEITSTTQNTVVSIVSMIRRTTDRDFMVKRFGDKVFVVRVK